MSIVAVFMSIKVPNLRENLDSFHSNLREISIGYFKNSAYRLALLCGVVAGTTHFILIGLIPEAFVNRGETLAIITGLIGLGRLVSVLGKYAAGWAFDNWGGVRSAQVVMFSMLCFGFLVLALPSNLGLIPVIPFVCFTAMLFPISNAIVIGSLPAKSSFGVGIYRASLMISSAVLSVVFSFALRFFQTFDVMMWALTIPAIGLFLSSHSSFFRSENIE